MHFNGLCGLDVRCPKHSVLARQGPSERDLCTSMGCVDSMFDGIDISELCVLTRQGQSERDLCTSMGCVNSMFDGIGISKLCVLARQEQSESDLMVSSMYLFLMFDEQIDDEAITDTMISST